MRTRYLILPEIILSIRFINSIQALWHCDTDNSRSQPCLRPAISDRIICSPEPLTFVFIQYIILGKQPDLRLVQMAFFTRKLVCVQKTNHCFSLPPPMLLFDKMSILRIIFIPQATIFIQPFRSRISNGSGMLLINRNPLRAINNSGALQQQPRNFDIMTIRDKIRLFIPFLIKKKNEMICLLMN